jgi:N-acetylglucosamine kinase-like BadF-type ATPase
MDETARRPPEAETGPDQAGQPAASDLLVMGIEAGTFRVDALVADLDGTVLGRGRSGSANPAALALADVAAHLVEAMTRALEGLDPRAVRSVVAGTAGILGFQRGRSAARLSGLWREAGLGCPVTVVPDAVTAFAAGTERARGSVLIAGAGAIAARVEREAVTARIDGNGWLVGDDGSGFWIGRQAVRAVFAALDGRGEPTLLLDAVLAALAGPAPVPAGHAQREALLRDAVYDGPPVALAALAPLVPAAAEAGDRVAHRIVEQAVELLVQTAAPLVADGLDADEPLVLAGSLLERDGPIRREVLRRLTERHGRAPLVARAGAGGALWLAARRIERGLGRRAHARFTAGD